MSQFQHSVKPSDTVKSAKKSKSPSRNMPYLSDIKLLPRMRKYLDDKTANDDVDVPTIVTFLQKCYPEYKRKKRTTFAHSVSRALDILTSELQTSDEDVDILSAKRPKRQKQRNSDVEQKNTTNDSDASFSDNEVYAEYQDSNALNSMVTNLYAKHNPTSTPQLAAAQTTSKSTGFARCQSDPVLNRDSQVMGLDDLGYIDRGPHTPLNTNKLVESLPSSPRPSHEVKRKEKSMKSKETSSKPAPVIITIGDEPLEVNDSMPAPSQGESQPISSLRKKSKPSNRKTGSNTPVSTPKNKFSNSAATPKKKGAIDAIVSTTKFSQLGGNEKTIEDVEKLMLHMRYAQIYEQIGVVPPRGFLLHGPPGCGKTLMAHAIAGELELPFFKLAATELVSGVSGESEERVRNLFQQASAHAPCVLFIDEVDAITPKRETASKDMERRIVSQFLTCLDDLCQSKDAQVLVIGATNRPDSLDPALRRAGRFDREISMGIPDVKARESILKVLCKDIRLADGFDYPAVSRLTPGFVGADLSSLVREAAMLAVNQIFASLESRILNCGTAQPVEGQAVSHSETGAANSSINAVAENTDNKVSMEIDVSKPIVEPANCSHSSTTPDSQYHATRPAPNKGITWKNLPEIPKDTLNSLHITIDHFLEAIKIVQPSAKREGFATVPDVTWEDIGALKSIREELQMAILAPVKYPEQFRSLGLNTPSGVLLAGPPGCGKTLLAKAIANESGINFISVKGPELINMYVGESEKAVRQVFQRARNSAPCVVFFDELDSLCPRRALSASDGGSGSRIVNQMLTEMDGLEERKQVFVMGATNRPDIIDPAVLRPGRLDKTLHVGLPTLEDRVDILKTITKDCTKPAIEGVDLSDIASLPQCDGFSGADLTAVVREASMAAMKEYISKEMTADTQIVLNRDHFDIALSRMKPSISVKDRERYKAMSMS